MVGQLAVSDVRIHGHRNKNVQKVPIFPMVFFLFLYDFLLFSCGVLIDSCGFMLVLCWSCVAFCCSFVNFNWLRLLGLVGFCLAVQKKTIMLGL